VERAFVSPDFVRLGTRLGCAEMIRSGVTCFADMYYFEEAIAEATTAAGMRALCAQTVLRFPTPDATSYEESLARARDFIQRWRGHPLIVPAPAPHAPYTCTSEILRACAELAVEFDVPLHIHLSETTLEVDRSEEHTSELQSQSNLVCRLLLEKKNWRDICRVRTADGGPEPRSLPRRAPGRPERAPAGSHRFRGNALGQSRAPTLGLQAGHPRI